MSKKFLKKKDVVHKIHYYTWKNMYIHLNVSIWKTMGSAKIQLIKPNPKDDGSADTWEKLARTNTVEK